MGGGNAAKSAMKRERNLKNSAGGAKSQLKVNEAAKDIQCDTCKATFLKTTREKALNEHAVNKHNKTIKDCFPSFEVAPAAK